MVEEIGGRGGRRGVRGFKVLERKTACFDSVGTVGFIITDGTLSNRGVVSYTFEIGGGGGALREERWESKRVSSVSFCVR
jgi:hypothetical protein